LRTTKYRQTRMAVLEVSKVSEAFQHAGSGSQRRQVVVNNISTGVKDRGTVAIMGISGKEKGPLLNTITRVEIPNSVSPAPLRERPKVPANQDRVGMILNELVEDFQFARRETRTETVQ